MIRTTFKFRTFLDLRLRRFAGALTTTALLAACGPVERAAEAPSADPSSAAAPGARASAIAAVDARARVTLPGRTMTAGYMTLTNGSDRDLRLVDARSPRMGRIELHTHEREGDLVRMRRIPHVELPAGGSAVFEPGHDHLMMFEVEPPLGLGESFTVTLIFADGTTADVRFVVVPIGG